MGELEGGRRRVADEAEYLGDFDRCRDSGGVVSYEWGGMEE